MDTWGFAIEIVMIDRDDLLGLIGGTDSAGEIVGARNRRSGE